MRTLTGGLNKFKVSESQSAEIRRVAQQYHNEGHNWPESNRMALEELTTDTQEQLKNVSKQINGKQNG